MNDWGALQALEKEERYRELTKKLIPLEEWLNEHTKCECGRDAVGEGCHSDWCPKYKKVEKKA